MQTNRFGDKHIFKELFDSQMDSTNPKTQNDVTNKRIAKRKGWKG